MKKVFLLFIFAFALIGILTLPAVMAHCPLCTAAAGAGVAAARFYGVDDSIVGLFIGALIVSTALWFNKSVKKRWNYALPAFIVVLISFLLFAGPFYYTGLITNVEMVKSMPEHHAILGLGVLGIDKLLAGMIIGSLAVWGAFTLSDHIVKKRGKRLFDYQGLSFMIMALIILSLVFWLVTKGA